jgi:uncharacterized protein (TIGR02391 family)
MRKTDDEILIEKLSDYEKRCDGFLQILQDMEILNLNFDTPSEAVIDVFSPEWQMFHNDLLATTKRYKADLDYDFNPFISIFEKATKYPNFQNISNLKVSLYSLKNHILDTLNDNITETGIWMYIHPQIAAVSQGKFSDGYYADAVESAFKEINTRVKRLYKSKTGEERDGSDLMRKAFSSNAPVLIFESQNTQSGKNIQNGYMDMFAGAMTGIRNPKAHENMTITECQAVQRLMFASLLMTKIDEAVEFMGLSE